MYLSIAFPDMQTVLEMWNISENFLVKRSLLKDIEDIRINHKVYIDNSTFSHIFPDLSKKSKYSDKIMLSDYYPKLLEPDQLISKDHDKRIF
jgi:hypothetical protein